MLGRVIDGFILCFYVDHHYSAYLSKKKKIYGYLEQNEDAWGGGKNSFISYL